MAADLTSLLIIQDHQERRLRIYEAALRCIAGRQFTSDVVYERLGQPTARELAQAALDGEWASAERERMM